MVVHAAGSTRPDVRWFDGQSARPPRTDGPAARASNPLRTVGRLPWPVQSPDPRGEREDRGVRDERPRSDGGYGTAWPARAGSRQPHRQRPARRLRRRSEKFESSQVSEPTGPESPQHRVPAIASMSGKPLATSGNTRFGRRSQSCQTLYAGPPSNRRYAPLRRGIFVSGVLSLRVRHRAGAQCWPADDDSSLGLHPLTGKSGRCSCFAHPEERHLSATGGGGD